METNAVGCEETVNALTIETKFGIKLSKLLIKNYIFAHTSSVSLGRLMSFTS